MSGELTLPPPLAGPSDEVPTWPWALLAEHTAAFTGSLRAWSLARAGKERSLPVREGASEHYS